MAGDDKCPAEVTGSVVIDGDSIVERVVTERAGMVERGGIVVERAVVTVTGVAVALMMAAND